MQDITDRNQFEEISKHLLMDERPSVYINSLSNREDYGKYPFTLLWKLKETEQSKKYHPEGSVWNHTLLVVDEAAKVRGECCDEKAFMWAALLHDIGKPDTTRIRNGRTTSYDHDKAGEQLSIDFLSCFTQEEAFIHKVAALVRYHMHMLYVLKDLPYADVDQLLRRVDIQDITLLSRCDRFGRTGVDKDAEEAQYREYLKRLMQKVELNKERNYV